MGSLQMEGCKIKLDLKNKITFISGLNGSGKSYFTKNAILPNYHCLIHDPLKEYPSQNADVFYPKLNYPAIAEENEKFIQKKVIPDSGKYDLLIYEEASRTFPNSKPLYPIMRSFFDTYRHYNNLGMVFICRRPAQIFTDIPSLAHHLICFGNKGSADIQRLNQESEGLGDLVKHLSNYDFVFVDQDRDYKRMPHI